MIDSVAVGTEIRVTTDKWESAGFGPEKGETGTVTTSGFTGRDELPVLFSDGVYFVKDGEFEIVGENAAFQPGDRVRIVSSPDPAVPTGTEGVVLSLDDPKLFLAILLGGEPPAGPNIVDFEDGFIGLQNHEIELVERVEDAGVTNTDGVEVGATSASDPDVPVGTHVILTTDIFRSYATGDRGVVVKHGACHVVEMEDGGELYLDPSEFTVSEAQPEADLADWEKELLAAVPVEIEVPETVLTRGEFVAFELTDVSWDHDYAIRILNVGDKYFHLEIAGVVNRVAPKLSADERRLLGQALIESAEIGE